MKILIIVSIFISLISPSSIESDTHRVGDSVWMTKNLNVSEFRNGDEILEAKSSEEWMNAFENKTPAYCYYENDIDNAEKFGKLYNWFAVNDERGLAPEGWHVATDSEWSSLIEALHGVEKAGIILNDGAFQSVSAGLRDHDGSFNGKGFGALYWTSTVDFNFFSYNRQVFSDKNSEVTRGSSHHAMGLSVRCVEDKKR